MAKSENNEVMYGARGRVGNLVVFKNFGKDRTIISKVRRKVDKPIYSAEQSTVKEKFKEAVIYAKGIIADPDLLAFYKRTAKPGASAYNMALADFCKVPEIKVIDLSTYQGELGNQIRIRAIDNFRVASVKLSITGADGVLIETGAAILSPNGVDWFYQTTVLNNNLLGTLFNAEATDMPGNKTSLETVMS